LDFICEGMKIIYIYIYIKNYKYILKKKKKNILGLEGRESSKPLGSSAGEPWLFSPKRNRKGSMSINFEINRLIFENRNYVQEY
jgi:hypothetical protein